jgi:hypothetical protein
VGALHGVDGHFDLVPPPTSTRSGIFVLAAVKALIMAAEGRGSPMHAHIGMLRALNRQHVRSWRATVERKTHRRDSTRIGRTGRGFGNWSTQRNPAHG